jgi:hypothetical protein
MPTAAGRPFGLWDVLSREVVTRRAAIAPTIIERGVTQPSEALDIVAREILEGLSDGSDETRFLNWARAYIGRTTATERRNRAAALAVAFGADPIKLIRFLQQRGVLGTIYSDSKRT